MLSEEIIRLRNRIITGTYAIGPEGKEPTNWRDYALKLESHILKLELTMIAAAEEIQQHWQAHCDEDGYGPSNLMHRLENGIAANYEGYKFGQFTKLQDENVKLQNLLYEDFIKKQFKSLEQIQKEWGDSNCGKSLEEYIYNELTKK